MSARPRSRGAYAVEVHDELMSLTRGVANAPSHQMLLAAFGFQPQDQASLDAACPWSGFRVGMVGSGS
jgi:hypothetical protein